MQPTIFEGSAPTHVRVLHGVHGQTAKGFGTLTALVRHLLLLARHLLLLAWHLLLLEVGNANDQKKHLDNITK